MLKLSHQDLVLFLLKSSLSLFNSSLELFLLNLKSPPLLVKLMNGTSNQLEDVLECPLGDFGVQMWTSPRSIEMMQWPLLI